MLRSLVLLGCVVLLIGVLPGRPFVRVERGAGDSATGRDPNNDFATDRWKFVGPQPIIGVPGGLGTEEWAGYVTAIAVDPANPNHALLGGEYGGVWETHDVGGTWVPVADDHSSLAVGDIVYDPANSQHILVGLRDRPILMESGDGGASWTEDLFTGSLLYPRGVTSVVVLPDGSRLLGVTHGGIYRSPGCDGSGGWTQVYPAFGYVATWSVKLVATAGSSPVILAEGLKYGGDLLRSTDGGCNWSIIAAPISTGSYGYTAIATAPSDPNRAYLFLIGSNNSPLGAYRSDDAGQTWTSLPLPLALLSACRCPGPPTVLEVLPTDANVVYFGGMRLVRSSDAGQSWTPVFGYHDDVRSLAFAPDGSRAFIGTDGGIWKFDNPVTGTSSLSINHTLGINELLSGLSMAPGDPGTSMSGMWHTGVARRGPGLAWSYVGCGDGGATAVLPNGSGYFVCHGSSYGELKYVQPDGTVTTVTIPGVSASETGDVLAQDPHEPNRVYWGTDRVFRRDPLTGVFEAISAHRERITAMRVAPSSLDTVWVAYGDGKVMYSVNAVSAQSAGDVIWIEKPVGGSGTLFGNGPIIDVVVSARAADRVFAVRRNIPVLYPRDDAAFVGDILSTDASRPSWTASTKPAEGINSLHLVEVPRPSLASLADRSMASADRILAATDLGAFQYVTGSGRSELGSGLPKGRIVDLVFDGPSGTLRAASYGRGAWDLHLPTADLAVTVSTPVYRPALHRLQFRVDLQNTGPDPAIQTQMSVVSGEGLPMVQISGTGATCSVRQDRTIKYGWCRVGDVPSAQRRSISIAIDCGACSSGRHVVRAEAWSTTPEVVQANNKTLGSIVLPQH